MPPLLANVLLDEVDRELERRGHCFVRYADDANVYVRSQRAGQRVMSLLKRLYEKLHLSVNESKSAVTSAFGRKFLGYAFLVLSGRSQASRFIQSAKAVQAADMSVYPTFMWSQFAADRR